MPSIATELLVIGGGATGLGIAWDACLRGMKVVVVEQGDLGQGTSGRYHGILHSGGRYAVIDPPSARDCAHENRILRQIAPQTIEDTGGLFIALPGDSTQYPEQWLSACRRTNVEVEEISLSQTLNREPLLNPRIQRAYFVNDAALDSFELLQTLARGIRQCGGQVRLRHRVDSLILQESSVIGAEITSLSTLEKYTIGAEMIVNAAGPWAHKISALAGINLPIALSRGTMLAVAARPVHTIINRCRRPSDGDILVPVGTVAVMGTTDVPVENPTDLDIAPWEIDFLLAQGEALVPGFQGQRPLRAWAGTRPLYRPEFIPGEKTRELPRAHLILNHMERDGVHGLVSILGGKLTTFRLMAEQTVDLVCRLLSSPAECRTHSTPLPAQERALHTLPKRLRDLSQEDLQRPPDVICECELVTRSMFEEALKASESLDLDDYRRQLRLGMGPCQAGFCGYRAAAIVAEYQPSLSRPGILNSFLEERWRGIRPLGWGHGLRQMEFMRRIYLDLLGISAIDEDAT